MENTALDSMETTDIGVSARSHLVARQIPDNLPQWERVISEQCEKMELSEDDIYWARKKEDLHQITLAHLEHLDRHYYCMDEFRSGCL